jgi:predicted metal-dependent phosphoesterase TrpH
MKLKHALFFIVSGVMSCGGEQVSTFSKLSTKAEKDQMQFYFGSLHSHTRYSDGKGSPEEALRWARDEKKLDFYAITDHDFMTSSGEWADILAKTEEFDQPGRFVALRGFEFTHPIIGHYSVFHSNDYVTALGKSTLQKFYQWISEHDVLVQFNHPGPKYGTFEKFAFEPRIAEKIVAIETGNTNDGNASGKYLGYYQQALASGWWLAPTNNSDNHSLTMNSYRTVVVAPSLTQENVYEAMRARRMYSADDRNIKIRFLCDGHWMGSIVKTSADEVECEVKVSDDEPVDVIELVDADGAIVDSIQSHQARDVQWNLRVKLNRDFSFYHVRVYGRNTNDIGDGQHQIAVTSPIGFRRT